MNRASDTKRDVERAGLHAHGHAVPLLGVEVRAEVVAGHATAVVRQRYRNDEARPIEAVYTFPLPTRGAVTGFAMTVNGRHLVGEVEEREAAFRRYDDAISAGHGSALLEQERPNVFTANVGNLLPGEETVIEIAYVEPVTVDEGAVRWSLPTLVAPRYVPGAPSGDRTSHGTADPTSRVPDADRISPPIGSVAYGISLDLVFDLGCEVEVESPSHAVRAERVDGHARRTRVTFSQSEVALDRDIVVTAFPKRSAFAAAPLASVVAHRAAASAQGTFALSLVPDLAGGLQRRTGRSDVVFVLDRSGSMEGTAMAEAKTALRLCLRQLREGDRFAVIAFDDSIETMSERMTGLTPATLREADRWIDAVDARGGTEMLEPLVQAAELAPNGIIVLLTDGQVANEDEIQAQLLAKRATARVYAFGIGTNVSDALLVGLAEKTGGAVEMIHPGERVDDKVVAQFARATAPRVTGVQVSFRGVDVGEIAPAEPVALVDGEPFTIFGTYEAAGIGAVELRGTYEGEKFYLEIPIDLPEREERPAITRLWAQARIRDLEHATLSGRRAETMKQRIVQLAKEFGVSSRYTSFVVVEKRVGDRRVNEQADTRVVPVNAPADWGMFKAKKSAGVRACVMPMMISAPMSRAPGASSGPPPPPRAMSFGAGAPPPPKAAPSPMRASRASGGGGFVPAQSNRSHEPMPEDDDGDFSYELAERDAGRIGAASYDPITALLERQSTSGMWDEPGSDPIELTVRALLTLLRLGVTSTHPVHGAQTKKAIAALLDAIDAAPALDPRLAELALGALWLLSTGRRTRLAIKDAAARRSDLTGLVALLGHDDVGLRAHVERIATV